MFRTGAFFSIPLLFTHAGWAADVDFQRDIQPLFAEHCYECHGPDKQKGGLNLTTRQGAMKMLESGALAIDPAHPEKSEALVRMTSTDGEDVMPPRKKAKRPSADQIAVLKKWIAFGAEWTEHWAYRPVTRAPLPSVEDEAWVKNEVDRFILARLDAEGLRPSPRANAFTLCRRLYLDLTGLLPTPEEADDFAKAAEKDLQKAVEVLTDRLLASLHFGERWGRHWLDKARYADSDGYEKDRPRPDAWRYRDWVIEAINRDMSFDQFTIEQLAGDLLPGATAEQKLATAFHRQTLTNTEGGVDQEQFRNEAVFDRTETTGAVWLGLTVGCARCHTHKYDQISHHEYYQLFAFFNNGDEAVTKVGRSAEALADFEMKNAGHLQKLKQAEERLADAREKLKERLPSWEQAMEARLAAAEGKKAERSPMESDSVTGRGKATFAKLSDGSWLAGGEQTKNDTYTVTAKLPRAIVSGFVLEVLPHESLPEKGPGRAERGNFVLSEIGVKTGSGGVVELHSPKADFEQPGWKVTGAIDGAAETGWGISGAIGKSHNATFQFAKPLDGAAEGEVTISLHQAYQKGNHSIGRFRLVALTGEPEESVAPAEVRRLVRVGIEKWTNENVAEILNWVVKTDAETRSIADNVAKIASGGPAAPVMDVRVISQRATPRETRVFHRGEFLSPSDRVQPGVLALLPPLQPRKPDSADRLDLARWIVSRENPLTPRVTVNHLWTQLFGAGIVRTENDFGVRGETPSHPGLLDWLADEFMAKGWSRKHILRLIVTSATYQQSAALTRELQEADPLNRFLARQSRVRVEGEIVRDIHLSASGLLSEKVGGPSVFPSMPAEVAALSYANNFKWTESAGDDRHRRGMYTFFKRTAPHPDLMTFDCPDANTACVKRTVSDTPLQALAMLNARVFADAARALSARVLQEVTGEDSRRLERAFRLCLTRLPSAAETARLQEVLVAARAFYTANPAEAKKLIGNAKEPNAVELAAWTAMTRIVMNTDEFITRN